MPKKIDPALRDRAVRLVLDGIGPACLARNIGLNRWWSRTKHPGADPAEADQGVNPRTLAGCAAKADLRIMPQTTYELSVGLPKKFPQLYKTVAALAYASDISQRAVVLAYDEGLGFDVGQVDLAAMLPESARDLTIEQQPAILAVIKAMNPPLGSQPRPRNR